MLFLLLTLKSIVYHEIQWKLSSNFKFRFLNGLTPRKCERLEWIHKYTYIVWIVIVKPKEIKIQFVVCFFFLPFFRKISFLWTHKIHKTVSQSPHSFLRLIWNRKFQCKVYTPLSTFKFIIKFCQKLWIFDWNRWRDIGSL